MRLRLNDDSGVYAILYGLLVVVTVMTAAIVVDLSGMREDRRGEKLAADAAATAGAIKLNALNGTANAHEACVEAWRFLKVNLAGAAGATANCPTVFPTTVTTCPSSARTASGPAGPWNVTITWPVPDAHALMTDPNVTGRESYTQPFDPEVDGTDPCGRLGVTISRDRDFAFASVGGYVDGTTTNSSVARAELMGTVEQEFPLVVLDQTGCQSLYVNGVGSLIKVSNNGLTPGRIAMDSDASDSANPFPGCGNANQYVAMRNGSGAKIVALNGSSGAPGMILTHASPLDKAANFVTDVCAAGTDPALSSQICPRPTPFIRITRSHWDWKYHCSSSTALPLSAPCPYDDPDYIQDLRDDYNKTTLTGAVALANPGTWRVISGAACTVTTPITYPDDKNTYVNCPNFQVRDTTVFQGGLVVFAGDVSVTGGASAQGCLRFNYSPPATGEGPCVTEAAEAGAGVNGDMIVYLQDGNLTRQNLDFVAPRTFIYQEASTSSPYSADQYAVMDFGAGTAGAVLITAPEDGDFEDLAIWSENFSGRASGHPSNGFGASTNLVLEGILFFPNGRVKLSGQPDYFASARSQFVAWSLEVFGGAQLLLIPDPERTLTIPVGGVRLIR